MGLLPHIGKENQMKKIISITAFLFAAIFIINTGVCALNANGLIEQVCSGINERYSIKGSFLSSDYAVKNAGSENADWLAFAYASSGKSSGADKYLAALKNYVVKNYKNSGGFAKYTEYHRIILTVSALGGNPQSFGSYNGKTINLLKDGVFNAQLEKQGLSACIWALIAADCKNYAEPNNSRNTRNKLISFILKMQNKSGGWALAGNKTDADITAMAVTALSPYYNSEKRYTGSSNRLKLSIRVRDAVDKALSELGGIQKNNACFESYGIETLESTAQVLVALSSLGINSETDKRFVKNKTIFSALQTFRSSGGFSHTSSGKYNEIATYQGLYALIAHKRYTNGERALFDLRPPQTAQVKSAVTAAVNSIKKLDKKSSGSEIYNALKLYNRVPESERRYVYNYSKLSDLRFSSKPEIKNGKVYLGGRLVRSKFVLISSKRYYANSNGKIVKNTVKKIKGKYYAFNKKGVQYRKVRWVKIKSKWYHINKKGRVDTKKLLRHKRKRVYVSKNGAKLKRGRVKVKKTVYIVRNYRARKLK